MLTYDLSKDNFPLYQNLYECIKNDIVRGIVKPCEKIPSKRALAKNLGISTITVEKAYDRLIDEGYIFSEPKRGYFASRFIEAKNASGEKKSLIIDKRRQTSDFLYDFSESEANTDDFPFSVWARLMREVIAAKSRELLTASPCEGVFELRCAIKKHLASFRGMEVDPDQIIVGAGTEYLYSLLIKLLGTRKNYCLENPGYKKLAAIYQSNGAKFSLASLDEDGILPHDLEIVDVVHTSPTHHFPTGITMPPHRRYELLSWANEREGRYIVEDDYDSEFRQSGRPIPPLYTLDAFERIIYMNTFSKTLTPTIRISYMVLPAHLANRFYEKLAFYSSTVSTFEQYTLAAFLSRGFLEKHINRMRRKCARRRTALLDTLGKILSEGDYRVIESGSGLHFLVELRTSLSGREVKNELAQRKINIKTVDDYRLDGRETESRLFMMNYFCEQGAPLENALYELKNILDKAKNC